MFIWVFSHSSKILEKKMFLFIYRETISLKSLFSTILNIDGAEKMVSLEGRLYSILWLNSIWYNSLAICGSHTHKSNRRRKPQNWREILTWLDTHHPQGQPRRPKHYRRNHPGWHLVLGGHVKFSGRGANHCQLSLQLCLEDAQAPGTAPSPLT